MKINAVGGAGRRPLRVAIGLSGGVDSSVTALLTRHLLRTHADVDALRRPMLYSTCSGREKQKVDFFGEEELRNGNGLAAIVAQRRRDGLSLPPWTASEAIEIITKAMEGKGRSQRLPTTTSDDSSLTSSQQPAAVGYFMRNWRRDDHHFDNAGATLGEQQCQQEQQHSLHCAPSEADLEDARFIAEHPTVALDAFRAVDFSADYYHRVFEPMLSAFFAGASVNPDVYCNSEVKFKSLLRHARRFCSNGDTSSSPHPPAGGVSIGLPPEGRCDFIATGHYARTLWVPTDSAATCTSSSANEKECLALVTPAESYCRRSPPQFPASSSVPSATTAVQPQALNDQSHYLSRLCPSSQLPFALFPLGALLRTKADVRAVGTHFFGPRIGQRATSVGLCFVAEHLRQPHKPQSPTIPPSSANATCTTPTNSTPANSSTTAAPRRAVAPQSAFRDLLAREYLGRLCASADNAEPPLLSNVRFFLVPPGVTKDALDSAVIDGDEGAIALAALGIIPIPNEAVVVSDGAHCFPFDFPAGKKVQVRGLSAATHTQSASDPLAQPKKRPAAGGAKAQRQQKAISSLYVCGRRLVTSPDLVSGRCVAFSGGVESALGTTRLAAVFLSEAPKHAALLSESFRVAAAHSSSASGESNKDTNTSRPTIHWLLPGGEAAAAALSAKAYSPSPLLFDGTIGGHIDRGTCRTTRALVACRHHDDPSPCVLNAATGEVTLLPTCPTSKKEGADGASGSGEARYGGHRKYNVTSGQTAVFYVPLEAALDRPPEGDIGVGDKPIAGGRGLIAVASSVIL